jgi:hypothetical protein
MWLNIEPRQKDVKHQNGHWDHPWELLDRRITVQLRVSRARHRCRSWMDWGIERRFPKPFFEGTTAVDDRWSRMTSHV